MPHSRADTMRVEERRAKVSALVLQGLRPHEIAARLGDSSNTGQTKVRQDLVAIRRQWKDSTVRDFDGAKTRVLVEIALLKREAWAAYERSKRDRVTVRDRELLTRSGRKRRRAEVANGDTEGNPSGGLEVSAVEHETRTEHSVGDSRYLKIVSDLVAEEALLLGLTPRPGEQTSSPPVLAIRVKVPEGYLPNGYTVNGAVVPPERTAPSTAPDLPSTRGQDLPRLPPPPDDSGEWEWDDDDEEDNGDGLATER